MANEAPPQTDELYGPSGWCMWTPVEPAGTALVIRARSSMGPRTRGRPEPTMSVARSVAEVLRDHVLLEVEAIDRMYLNVYVPHLQSVGAVVGYLRVHRGQRFASTTAVTPMTEAFVRNIDQFITTRASIWSPSRSGSARTTSRRNTCEGSPDARAFCMSARPRKRRGSCARSVAAADTPAEPIRGSWNPPRWSTTTISTASMRTSGHSS